MENADALFSTTCPHSQSSRPQAPQAQQQIFFYFIMKKREEKKDYSVKVLRCGLPFRQVEALVFKFPGGGVKRTVYLLQNRTFLFVANIPSIFQLKNTYRLTSST